MRVLVVEDEPLLADAIRDGLRLEAIAADTAGDGDTALELLSINCYDIAVLDRDIPGSSATSRPADRRLRHRDADPDAHRRRPPRLPAPGSRSAPTTTSPSPSSCGAACSGSGPSTAGAAHSRPPVRELAGVGSDPFRREVYRDGRYVALTRKQFAVLDVLVAADGGVVSAEELLERAWDENADPFTNAVRITVSALRKRLGRAVGHRHRARSSATASPRHPSRRAERTAEDG